MGSKGVASFFIGVSAPGGMLDVVLLKLLIDMILQKRCYSKE
jgi:hypothetical protein